MSIENNEKKKTMNKLAYNKKLRDFLSGKTLAARITCCVILEYMHINHISQMKTSEFLALNSSLCHEISNLAEELPESFDCLELGLTDSHMDLLHTEIALKRKLAPAGSLTPMGLISLLNEMKIKNDGTMAVISDDIVCSEVLEEFSSGVKIVHCFRNTSDELYRSRKIMFLGMTEYGITSRNRLTEPSLALNENMLNETETKYSMIIITQNDDCTVTDSELIEKAEPLLEDKGLLIYCVSPKFLTSDEHSQFRMECMKRQNIHSVFELKNASSNPVFAAVVLSKQASDRIRFISVENIIPSYRKPQNETSRILEVSYSDINSHGTQILSPDYYINSSRTESYEEKCRQFDDVVDLSRGSYTPISKVQERFTDAATGIKYLNLSGIENGTVKENIPNLTEIAEIEEKYVVTKGDFVMSKIVNPLRFAEITADQRYLVSVNMYILRPKTEFLLPEYFKAYFESEDGQQQLRGIARGDKALSVIEVRELKKLKIPCPDLEEQRRFVAKLKKLKAEEKFLEEKLDEIRKKKGSLLKDLLAE